jgi:hypothetical protein
VQQTRDKQLDALWARLVEAGEPGMTRTEVNAFFQRNVPSARIDAMVARLVEDNLVVCIQEPFSSGRPAVRLVAVSPGREC